MGIICQAERWFVVAICINEASRIAVLQPKLGHKGFGEIDGALVLEDVEFPHRVEHCDSLLRELTSEVIIDESRCF